MEPAKPPPPTVLNLPCHPESGSQVSKPICDSPVRPNGWITPRTRQYGGSGAPLSGSADAVVAEVIVVSGSPAKVALAHGAGAAAAVLGIAEAGRTAKRAALR